MRVDISVFVRHNTGIFSRVNNDGSCAVLLEGAGGVGDDVRLHFGSLEQAGRFADAIYHLRMDQDADAMQVSQEVAK